MGQKQVQNIIEQSLEKTHKEWPRNKLLIKKYLDILERNQSLEGFIKYLYENMLKFQLQIGDIRNFLVELGKHQQIIKLFGKNFFDLWIQFQFLKVCKINERIKEFTFEDFPKQEGEQLKFLKEKCQKLFRNYSDGTEKEVLKQMKKQPLFKNYMMCLGGTSEMASSSSLIQANRLSQVASSMTVKDKINYGLNLFERIIKQIREVSDAEAAHEDLREHLEKLSDKPGIQRELLCNQFRDAMFNILHIDMRPNSVVLDPKCADIIMEGFNDFKNFYKFQRIVSGFLLKQTDLKNLFQNFKILLKQINTVWYWPTIEGESLFALMKNECLKDQNMERQFLNLLREVPPTLSVTVFATKQRLFILEAICQVPNVRKKKQYLDTLIDLAITQNFDLNQTLMTGETYLQILVQLQASKEMLKKYQQSNKTTQSAFEIYDLRTKQRYPIFLEKQHRCELIDKILDNHSYIKQVIDSHYYHLEYTITSQKIEGHYQPTQYNKQHGSMECSGYLIYKNFEDLRTRMKQFTYKILTKQCKQIAFEFIQNESIRDQIAKIHQTKQKFPFFMPKINSFTGSIEINAYNLRVRAMKQMSHMNNSLMKEDFGILIYAPIYKDIQQEIEEITQNEGEDTLQMVKYNIKRPQFISEEEAEKQGKIEQVIGASMTFKYLGVFSEYFAITEGFQINQKKHVIAFTRYSQTYFALFESTQIYNLMDKFTLRNRPDMVNDKISTIFQLKKTAYPFAVSKMKEFKRIHNKQVMINYKEDKKLVVVQNMVQKIQSTLFYKAFFQYCNLSTEQENQLQRFIMKVNKSQAKYIQESQLPHFKVISKIKDHIQIECTEEEKNKLKQQIDSLDEINSFTYHNPEILTILKQVERQFLSEISFKEEQITEDTFTVSYKLRYHRKFYEKYMLICQREAQKPSQIVQQCLKNEGDFLHIYRKQLQNIDDEISVTRMGEDILIEFSNKIKKQVNRALERIQGLKQEQILSIAKRSSKQYQIKGIDVRLLSMLVKNISELIKSKATNAPLKTHIKFESINYSKTEFMLTGEQMNAEQEKILEKWMNVFMTSFNAYKDYKKQVYDTQKYFNKTFKKLPANKQYKKKMAEMNHKFKVFLKVQLQKQIQVVVEESNKQLVRQFQQFVEKSNLDKTFSSKIPDMNTTQIQDKLNKIGVFQKFVEFIIDQLDDKHQKPQIKAIMITQTKQIVNKLELKFKQSKLDHKEMSSYFKTLNILSQIYFGAQLPITPHLQDFKKVLDQHDVVMVKVGTGTGKSTVIPPYLVASGYSKVVVTQPRRLPCRQIYKRINSVFGKGISGYEVGDGRQDIHNNLLYMTDGLLKMRALFHEATVFDSIDVLVIDEIHERSVNIDILLLLLYCYYREEKRKMKLVLCSATIDSKIGGIMKDAGLTIGVFEPQIPNKYTIKQCPFSDMTIIEKIVQLSKKLKNDEQMLVFFAGVNEVLKYVKILNQKYHKEAIPITANQNPRQQERNIQKGQIFISTAIAETSLTFRNLKYVVDSRLSRWRTFDPELELMKTEEDYSSNSSSKQRKGRVGRNCNGEYHYYVYQDYDYANNREHNPTELQKSQFTNVIFELLLRKDTNFKKAVDLLKKLKHDPTEFDKKIQHSKNILECAAILKSDGTLYSTARSLLNYGNLGNPQHNMVLYQGYTNGYLINVAYLVSFQMFGSVVAGQLIEYAKIQHKGGDLKVLHDFLVDTGNKINIVGIQESQISNEMRVKLNKSLVSKSFFNILIKIMIKTKQLLKGSNNNVPAPNNRWPEIMSSFMVAYNNRLFFNQALFGGNKNSYDKVREGRQICYEEKNIEPVSFVIDRSSVLYDKNASVDALVSMRCDISPLGECVMSICEKINMKDIAPHVKVILIGAEANNDFIEGTKPIQESNVFDTIEIDVKSKTHKVKVTNNFPKMILEGKFSELVDVFKTVIEPQRRNPEIKIDLKKILSEAVAIYGNRMKKNNMLPVINAEDSMALLEKLSFEDYKSMFSTLKYDMENNFDVNVEWDLKQSQIIAKNVKNIHLSQIINKLQNCFKWFSECQLISRQEYKIKPHYIGDYTNHVNKQILDQIMTRINEIVDSKIEWYVIKGWVNKCGIKTKYVRTARMVAVCWVLVNMFNCVVKGGFVRDWVVNGDQYLPPTVAERVNMLQKNSRNQFLEVQDDKVTPSDIDVEMSPSQVFDENRFSKEMKKLGIQVLIQDGGWRKHIIFDNKTQSGGFTADLIEPYTSMTHYTYDFDVNVMYVKKNNLSSIGMKIPLVYEYEKQQDRTKHRVTVSLGELMKMCMQKQMKALKRFIPDYRFKKFQLRGWKINKGDQFQPICYQSMFTQSFPIQTSQIAKISPQFYQKMVVQKKAKIIRIQHLRNKGWDQAFDSCQHWIINEREQIQKAKRGDQYNHFHVNSNNQMLFHGTRDVNGMKGIKKYGFDSRFYASGCMYGRGAYFADNPEKSNDYTAPPQRYMFICNVALGEQEVLNASNNAKTGPSKGYHSIKGTANNAGRHEYIIERWGQAKPVYLITYTC